MNGLPASLTPWLILAGLGAFHGANPAMGWLFAVGLGLQRQSRAVVLVSLAPIALGHAAAVAAALVALALAGTLMEPRSIARAAGAVLIGWSAWHAVYGHRRRVRIGMRTGLAGLALWSFLMAGAHGAGLMVLPAVMPLCLSDVPGRELLSGSLAVALAAVAVHTAAMLGVIAAVAVTVYDWTGLAFLRRGWVNLDLLWSAALALSGTILLVG